MSTIVIQSERSHQNSLKAQFKCWVFIYTDESGVRDSKLKSFRVAWWLLMGIGSTNLMPTDKIRQDLVPQIGGADSANERLWNATSPAAHCPTSIWAFDLLYDPVTASTASFIFALA
jgi:hypothetical protein